MTIDQWRSRAGMPVIRQPVATGGDGLAHVGQALTHAGLSTLDQVTTEQRRQQAEAQAKAQQAQAQRETLAAERIVAEQQSWADTKLRELRDGAEPGAPGFEDQAAEAWTQQRAQVLADPRVASLSAETRDLLATRLDLRVGHELSAKASEFAAGSRINKQVEDWQAILDARANRVLSNPDSHDAEANDMAGLLMHLQLPADRMRKVAEGTRTTLAKAAVRGQIDRDPAMAKEWLDGGRFDRALDPDAKAALLNAATAGIHKRDAEARQNAALTRAEVKADLADYEAALRAGRSVDYDPARILSALGPQAGRQALDMLDQAGKFGADAVRIRYASPDELAAILGERQAAQSGANDVRGFADRAQDLHALSTMVAERNRQLAADPAAYVAEAPAVAALWQAAAQGDAQATKTAVNASLAEQERLGVPAPLRRVLTKSQASLIVADIQSPDGASQDVGNRMAQMQEACGAQWPRAFAELNDAGLPPAAYLIGTMTNSGQEAARAALSEAMRTGDKALRSIVPPDELTDLRKGIQDKLADFTATTVHVDGGGDVAAKLSQGVELLALHYMSKGQDASTAVQNAYDDAIGKHYTLAETYRVPKAYNAEQVEDAADSALSALTRVDTKKSRYGDIWANQIASYLRAVKRRGFWVTNADETGLVLKDELGAAVTVDGQPVTLSFKKAVGAE